MAKKSEEKPKRKVTKRQLSHWKRQKRRRWIIATLGIAVIATVLGLVIGGLYCKWYPSEIKPLKETVVEVNGTKFDMQYFIDSLNFQLGGYNSLVSYYLDYTLESIEYAELIKQEAEELGFIISDDNVREVIESYGYDDNQATIDALRASMLLGMMKDEYFRPALPVNAEHRHVMVMFLESEAQVTEARDRLEAGESFADVAGELSLENSTREAGGDIGWIPEGVLDELLSTDVLESHIFESQIGGLSQPVYDEEMTKGVGYWLIEVLERDEEAGEVNVRAMLLSSEEEAQTVLSRLEDGEDFDELAEEYSQYGTMGSRAAIGWIAEGEMTDAFDVYAFDSEVELNTVSGVIRDEGQSTTGGYWLFEVAGSEIMDISEDNITTLVDDATEEWITLILENPDNVIISYLDDELKDFAIRKITGE